MSHEGIRISSKEEKARETEENRPLPRIAVTPEKVRVLLSEGKGLEIDWNDGHRSAWSFAWLRDACPCATCIEGARGTAAKPASRSPSPPICCPCMCRRSSLTALMPWAAMHSSSTGTTATPAAFILGSTCAASASAGSARLTLRRHRGRPIRAIPGLPYFGGIHTRLPLPDGRVNFTYCL